MEESITEEDKNNLTKAAYLSIQLVRKAELLREDWGKCTYRFSKYEFEPYKDNLKEIELRLEENSEYIHQILKKYFPGQTGMDSSLWEAREVERIKREAYIKRKDTKQKPIHRL